MAKTGADTFDWMNFYNTGELPHKPIFQFGANPEVEDVLTAQGNDGLRIFDDVPDAPAYQRIEPWAEGFKYIKAHPKQHFRLVCGICSTPEYRLAAVRKVEQELKGCANWCWTTVISGSAYKAVNVKPAPGVLILDMCYVAPFVTLSKHCVLLPGASVYHNSHIGPYSILVGGSRILGRSNVEGGTRVCCNAVVLPEAQIGSGSLIGTLQSCKMLRSGDWKSQ